MTTQTPLQTTPLPPLLALPLELILQILSYLSDTNHCSLIILRRTHSSFRHIIPRDRITSSPRAIKTAQLVFAEDNHSYLFPHDHYPCYVYFRALPGSKFDSFYKARRQVYSWKQIGSKRRKVVSFNRGGILKGTRYCNHCQALRHTFGRTRLWVSSRWD